MSDHHVLLGDTEMTDPKGKIAKEIICPDCLNDPSTCDCDPDICLMNILTDTEGEGSDK